MATAARLISLASKNCIERSSVVGALSGCRRLAHVLHVEAADLVADRLREPDITHGTFGDANRP